MVGRVIRRITASMLRTVLLHPRMAMGVLVVAGLAISSILVAGLSTPSGAPAAAAPVGTGRPIPASAAGQAPRLQADGKVPPAPAVESYLKGMTSFDANLMVSSLSNEMRQQMQAQGGLERLQQSLDQAKQRGVSYEEIAYIGGYPLRDGGRYFFYVMTRRGFVGPDQVDQVWFVFTVDPSGKIAKID